MKNISLKLSESQKKYVFTDEYIKRLYATDASAYRELPMAVAIPQNVSQIIELIRLAKENKTSLIPRTAGTSLAGQVVGNGIVVDVSKYFNQIVEINEKEEYVRVQPGVVRDDLNKALKPYGYFFAPETSTANRAMIGGMIGNNSCGSNSIIYGSTREHLLEVKVLLSDGSQAIFGNESNQEFIAHCNGNQSESDLKTNIYLETKRIMFDTENQISIKQNYPDEEIPRRNTGYALDMLLRHQPFNEKGNPFNFCSLIAGSEGTLAFITESKLKITKLPPPHKRLVCIHCHSIDESLRANLVALPFKPSASELMDHYILEATKRSIMYSQNRFFLEGDPEAILVVELTKNSEEEADHSALGLIEKLKSENLGYSFPIIKGDDIPKVWELRKAGLGLLSNVPGDEKAVPVIEDTAVKTNDLPQYIAEFNKILKKYGLYSVHYAHAGSGELHLRPILNLKTTDGRKLFRIIAEEIAQLVKKYNGSLSGEHGDGRLRGEFIKNMIGEKNYELCKEVKKIWDPDNIFNPNKIVDTPPMDQFLRVEENQQTKEYDTMFDFSANEGYVRSTEQCNGSGDCRKTHLSGGTMCPSYMATRNEKDTTRARANILREMLTHSEKKPFSSPEVAEVLDLCLSCKGCKSECPSNVDMAKLKSEWLYQNQKINGIPLKAKLMANFSTAMKWNSKIPFLYNFATNFQPTASVFKSFLGIAKQRTMPPLNNMTFRNWFKQHNQSPIKDFKKKVYVFCDEFTDYNDLKIGQKTVLLLEKLNYQVCMVQHSESGRTWFSKAILDKAKQIAQQNVNTFYPLISENTPLVGIEPSAILSFRDEYIDILRGEDQKKAISLSKNVFTIEEFLAKEKDLGNIKSDIFTDEKKLLKVHGHCHQKALSSMTPTKKILTLPKNFEVQMIPSGCCGMAGSFGYEKNHYDVSMQIANLVLFPTIEKTTKDTLIVASGTSCRHQIKDGTKRNSYHPVEILYDALKI